MTLDTASGLEWLDVTLTLDKGSVNTMLGRFAVGEFFGWGYATTEQIIGFFDEAGVRTTLNTTGSQSLDPLIFDPIVNDFLNLVGVTLDNALNHGVDGIHFSPSSSTEATHSIVDIASDQTFSAIEGSFGGLDSSLIGTGVGHWLVRGGATTFPLPPLPPNQVTIDIVHGKDPNIIKLFSRFVSVAILTTPTFDAATVNPSSVMLAGASVRMRGNGQRESSLKDVDKDGDEDLVMRVSVEQTTITVGDVEATLTGMTFGGTMIEGSDTIQVVP